MNLASKQLCDLTYSAMNFVTSVWERFEPAAMPMKAASSSEMPRWRRNALFARRSSYFLRSSGESVAGSTLRFFFESRASRLTALTAAFASATAARTRAVRSVWMDLSDSEMAARMASAVRTSAGAAAAAAGAETGAETVGTVTSAFAAGALRSFFAGAGAGAAGAGAGAAATGAADLAEDFFDMFDLTEETTAAILNAGMLLTWGAHVNH